MESLHELTILEAQQRVGMPFRHHFKPDNSCEGGNITLATCMERGMDNAGYDCSGLVIASLCSVLAVPTSVWPTERRHTQQLLELAEDDPGEPGDIRLYTSQNNRVHMAIATTLEEGIHASGVTQLVEEGAVTDKYGPFKYIQSIPLEHLCELVVENIG